MTGIAVQSPKPGREPSVKCEGFGSTQPPNPGKPDRGMKNEPGRVGARKARKIKSNLDPDLKGIRLRGARHLNILSAACHMACIIVNGEGRGAHGDWFPWLQPPRPGCSVQAPLSDALPLGQRMGRPAPPISGKERGGTVSGTV